MPRHQAPKKDVASCEKSGGAASRLRSLNIRMGKPGWLKTSHLHRKKTRKKSRRPVAKRKSKKTGKVVTKSQDDEKIKRTRAQGGCQGTKRRRRTWQAAKSKGEPQAGIDPLISEWGNPAS